MFQKLVSVIATDNNLKYTRSRQNYNYYSNKTVKPNAWWAFHLYSLPQIARWFQTQVIICNFSGSPQIITPGAWASSALSLLSPRKRAKIQFFQILK